MTPTEFLLSFKCSSRRRCIKAFGAWVEARTGVNPVAQWERDNGDVGLFQFGDDARATLREIHRGMTAAGFIRTRAPRHGDIVAATSAGVMVVGIMDAGTIVWASDTGGVGAGETGDVIMGWMV